MFLNERLVRDSRPLQEVALILRTLLPSYPIEQFAREPDADRPFYSAVAARNLGSIGQVGRPVLPTANQRLQVYSSLACYHTLTLHCLTHPLQLDLCWLPSQSLYLSPPLFLPLSLDGHLLLACSLFIEVYVRRPVKYIPKHFN